MLMQTTAHDVRGRYAGSALGLLWVAIYPLIFLGMYAMVFIFIYKVKFDLFNSNEYVALIFCGLLPFLGFAESLGLGVPSVAANSQLVKNTLFPIELIPVKAVFTSQVTPLVGTGFLLLTLIILGRLSWWSLLLPVAWGLQLMMSIGIVWILSSLNVFLRDIQNIINVVVLMLMMITPIAYPVDMIPSGLRAFLGLNPLYYVVVTYQDLLMNGRFPRGWVFWIFLGLSLGLFYLGSWFFGRMKGLFADNV